MCKINILYCVIVALVLGAVLLFHIHQSLMAHTMLQGFWYIRTEDDVDYYMILDDEAIQIIGTRGNDNVVLFQESSSLSFYPGPTLGKFSFSLKVDKDIPVLDISHDQNVTIDMYASYGILDIGTNDSKSRLVKDNAMTIAYATA